MPHALQAFKSTHPELGPIRVHPAIGLIKYKYAIYSIRLNRVNDSHLG